MIAETLAERVDRRLRAEWPATRHTRLHGEREYPPVRVGGATDALIKLAAQIAQEEAEK